MSEAADGQAFAAAPWSGAQIPPLARHRTGASLWIATTWTTLVVVLAATADLLPLRSPIDPDFTAIANWPGTTSWFGTDQLGRDIFSRTIFGARVSLVVGLLAPALGLGFGTC